MIPKIIHWCWLSNDPIPTDVQRYIDTWKKILPDYEIWLWNFERFDKSSSKWVSDAFDNKKYAFAADYIRLYALYNYGGIYLDSDVEVLKKFDAFLSLPTMMCYEYGDKNPEVAAFGVEKGSKWVGECLKFYESREFVKQDGTFEMTPLPQVIDKIIKKNGFYYRNINVIDIEKYHDVEKEIPILPFDYFSPKSFDTGKVHKTERTVCIHQFAGTWIAWYELMELRFWQKLGLKNKCITGKIAMLLKIKKDK